MRHRWITFTLLGITLIISTLIVRPAVAQTPVKCALSLQVLDAIGRYSETIKEQKVITDANGNTFTIILWVNPTTGSWTLTGTQGPMTCIFNGATSGYAGWQITDFMKGQNL